MNNLFYKIDYPDSIISTNDFSDAFTVEIYPAYLLDNQLTVSVQSQAEIELTFTIYDVSYRPVFQSHDICAEYLDKSLNLDYLNEGLYFIKIGNNRFSKVLKFFK